MSAASRARHIVAELVRRHVVPWEPSPIEADSTAAVDSEASLEDLPRLSCAVHAVRDGATVAVASRAFGIRAPRLSALLQAVGDVSKTLRLDYLPGLSDQGDATSTGFPETRAADLRRLAVSKPRVRIDAIPCAKTSAVITRLLARLDSRLSSFTNLAYGELEFLLSSPLTKGVGWTIQAAIPAHLGERKPLALAGLDVVCRLAAARGATVARIDTPRRRGPREITYTAHAAGMADAVKGPALVESMLISLAIARTPQATPISLQPTQRSFP